MDNIIKSVKGANGEIELFQSKIRIVRKGFGSSIFGGDKEILLSSITSIQ